MAFAVTSSVVHSSSLSHSLDQSEAAHLGAFQPLDRLHSANFSRRRFSMKPLNAEPKRNDSRVSAATTASAPDVIEKLEEKDYNKLAKELENASPLEIMDKALEKFGNDIAIAFK